MTNPADRAVLVTGCSSGIGRCVARGLHDRGYRVFATARDAEGVSALGDDGLESVRLDLADSSSIHDAVGEILERTDGRL